MCLRKLFHQFKYKLMLAKQRTLLTQSSCNLAPIRQVVSPKCILEIPKCERIELSHYTISQGQCHDDVVVDDALPHFL